MNEPPDKNQSSPPPLPPPPGMSPEKVALRTDTVPPENVLPPPLPTRGVTPPPLPPLPKKLGTPNPRPARNDAEAWIVAAIATAVIGTFAVVWFAMSPSKDSIASQSLPPGISTEPASTTQSRWDASTITLPAPKPSEETDPRLETEEKNRRAKVSLAIAQESLKARSFTLAENECRESVRLNPKDVDGWVCLGWAQAKQDRLSDAEYNFRYALHLQNTHTEANEGLTWIRIAQKDAEATYQMMGRLRELDPKAAERVLEWIDSSLGRRMAVLEFPTLGVPNSPFNVAFRARYDLYQRNNPHYFDRGDWAIRLARETDKALSKSR